MFVTTGCSLDDLLLCGSVVSTVNINHKLDS